MKLLLPILFLFLVVLQLPAQQDLKLWYEQPATRWVEALPVGNGLVGAMIFGGVKEDLIQLNETTLWSGGPVKTNVNPGASAHLPAIRKALLQDNDLSKADSLVKKMQGYFTESFLPMGDLLIKQDFEKGEPTNYYRAYQFQDHVTLPGRPSRLYSQYQ